MNAAELTIEGRKIGPGHAPFVIAEMSGNHNGKLDRALRLVDAAHRAGADALKLQTYTADTLTIDSHELGFRVEVGLWKGRSLYGLYGEAHTPWEWHQELFRRGKELGLIVFSTPFDASAVEFLERLNAPAYKIASFEIVDLPLLRRVARAGKPVIVSTGMATLSEIDEAVRTIREAGGSEMALLKCTSAYPASPEDLNLRTIPHLARAFGVPVGLSDHTLGIAAPVAAVAMGACIVEKHLTLARQAGGPDSAFSLEEHEFREMADAVRTAHRALGRIAYGQTGGETKNRLFRRSLYVVKDTAAGDVFTVYNVRSIRPGYGLHTRYLECIIGRRATRPVKRGTPLSWDLVGDVAL